MLSSFSSCEITTRFLSVGKHYALSKLAPFTYFIETGLREAKKKSTPCHLTRKVVNEQRFLLSELRKRAFRLICLNSVYLGVRVA